MHMNKELSLSLFTLDFEKITNTKTREYFREVVSSYNNGNYRSAVVVLYSVCVCDIVFKLVDLAELYGDKNAEEILKKYRSSSNTGEKSPTKSAWEKDLIDEACKKGLIDTVTKERLTNLYSLRNMAAHPILDQNYELYNPTKEETVALILTMYDRLLTQPSLFMSSIVDMLSDDLARIKDTFRANQNQFEIFIRTKYFVHLNKKYLQEVFKAFWKFCFVLDNDECDDNRRINLQLLGFILDTEKETCIDGIREDKERFRCSLDPKCLKALAEILAQFPFLYDELVKDVHANIEAFIEEDKSKVISWFLFASPEEFVDALETKWKVRDFAMEYRTIFEQYFEDNGRLPLMYDFYIYLFRNSSSFNDSSDIWNWLLKDSIKSLSNFQVNEMIQAFDSNPQINNNWELFKIRDLMESNLTDRK